MAASSHKLKLFSMYSAERHAGSFRTLDGSTQPLLPREPHELDTNNMAKGHLYVVNVCLRAFTAYERMIGADRLRVSTAGGRRYCSVRLQEVVFNSIERHATTL